MQSEHTLTAGPRFFFFLLCCCCVQALSRCSKWGLRSSCGVWASHCDGFSCCGTQAPGTQASVVGFSCCGTQAPGTQVSVVGFSCCGTQAPGTQASVVAVHGLSCSVAWGILAPPAKDGTHIPCTGRQTLNHWATRDVSVRGS